MAFIYDKYKESQEVTNAKKKLDQNSTYKESKRVTNLYNQLQNQLALKPSDWTGGTYGTAVNDAMNKILNRDKFTYDLNGDALYQQYKDQYINLGKMAMQDTMGQAAAMTGGYGNSYASTAGNQAYQGYLQQLNAVVPELYQMALDKYNSEGADLQNQYAMLANQYNTEYGEYRDKVGDWENNRAYLTDQYNNERNFDYSKFSDNRDYLSNAYQMAYNKDYGQYSDAYNRAFANYQQQVSEDQWNKSYALQQQELALSRQKASQSNRIAELERQLELAKGADYTDWKAVDWFDYFGEIKRTKGEDAAIKELTERRNAGDLPKEMMGACAAFIRGHMGR